MSLHVLRDNGHAVSHQQHGNCRHKHVSGYISVSNYHISKGLPADTSLADAAERQLITKQATYNSSIITKQA